MMPAWNCETLPWSCVDCLPARPQAAEVDALKEGMSCVGGGTRELKRELFSKLVQLAGHVKGTPLGAFPASSPMVAVQGQGRQSLAYGVEAGGRWEVARCGRPNRRS